MFFFYRILPELARKTSTVITPNTCLDGSQKQNDIIHKTGTNDVKELNNFLAFVNVITFARTRRSAIIPKKIKEKIIRLCFLFHLPDDKLLNNVKKNPNANI